MSDLKKGPSTEREIPSDKAPAPAADVETGKFFNYRGIFLIVLAILTLWLNYTFIVPVFMGAIFAICLHPLMNKLSRWKLSKNVRALLVTTLFAFSFLLPLGLMLYFSATAVLAKIQHLQAEGLGTTQLSTSGLIDALRLRPVIQFVETTSSLTEAQINKGIISGLTTVGTWGAGILQNSMANIPGALFGAFIIILTIYFLLMDGGDAVKFLKKNSIFGPRQTEKVFHTFEQLCNSTVVASIAAGAVQTILILIACIITGTPNAILISLIAFILSFLPMLGTAPVTLFLTAQAFFSGEVTHGIIFLVAVFVVGLSDNVVRPYVLKGGASLHPLVGFVAAFGALDVIGFYGVFIGPVVAGLFFALLPMITETYSRERKI